jgi:hypothetical protein
MYFLPFASGFHSSHPCGHLHSTWHRCRQQADSLIWASIAALALSLSGGAARGQTSPAHGPLPKSVAGKASPAVSADSHNTPANVRNDSVVDDIPLADYLALLGKIAPSAETGARSYLVAFQLRCGHPLSTGELRRAVSQDSGDPVLMGFIRAAQVQDITARQRLTERITCPMGGGR